MGTDIYIKILPKRINNIFPKVSYKIFIICKVTVYKENLYTFYSYIIPNQLITVS